jgi:hypothetical protein
VTCSTGPQRRPWGLRAPEHPLTRSLTFLALNKWWMRSLTPGLRGRRGQSLGVETAWHLTDVASCLPPTSLNNQPALCLGSRVQKLLPRGAEGTNEPASLHLP